MTQQLDMIPTPIAEDASVLARIAELLPKARDVRAPRLRSMFPVDEMFHGKQSDPSEGHR